MTTPPHIAHDIIRELEPVLAAHPDSMRFARLAEAYLATGRPDRAVELCEQGLRYHPKYATGKLVLAKALLAQREHTKALHTLKSLLDLDPRHPLGWRYYGDLQHTLGKTEAAELSYGQVLALDPLNEDVRAMLSALRQQQAAPSEEAAPMESVPSTGGVAEPSLAEPLEDRFSYILDDIFREEEGAPPAIEEEEPRSEQPADLREIFWPEPEVSPEERPVPAPPAPEVEPEPFAEDLFQAEEAEEEAAAPALERPEPPPAAPSVESAPPEQEERIVTPTLGEIYAAQGQYAKAISVFTILARKHPDNPRFRERIEQLQRKLEESTGKQQEDRP